MKQPLFVSAAFDEYGFDPFEVALLAHIARRGVCREGRAKLAAWCSMSEPKVSQSLWVLTTLGVLVVQTGQGRRATKELAGVGEWLLVSHARADRLDILSKLRALYREPAKVRKARAATLLGLSDPDEAGSTSPPKAEKPPPEITPQSTLQPAPHETHLPQVQKLIALLDRGRTPANAWANAFGVGGVVWHARFNKVVGELTEQRRTALLNTAEAFAVNRYNAKSVTTAKGSFYNIFAEHLGTSPARTSSTPAREAYRKQQHDTDTRDHVSESEQRVQDLLRDGLDRDY